MNKGILGLSAPILISLIKSRGSLNQPDDFFCLKEYEDVLNVPETKIIYSDVDDFFDRNIHLRGTGVSFFPVFRNSSRYIGVSCDNNIMRVRNFLQNCEELNVVFMDNETNSLRIEEAFKNKKAKDFFISKGYRGNMWLPASSLSTKSHREKQKELQDYGDYLQAKGKVINVGVIELKVKNWKNESNYLCSVWCSPCGFWRIYRADNENTFLLVRVNEDGSFTYFCRQKYAYHSTLALKLVASLSYCSNK